MNPPHWKFQSAEGGLLAFERDSGTNVLLRNGATAGLRRTAPRALQIGLLTPCNLKCSFCYRDTTAPSRLTAEFLEQLLVDCAAWGVLEVAFGGGEPLLFKDFPALVRRLTKRTSLGVNFTTNGMLLTDAALGELGDWPGEIRLSAYPDNHYRATLRRLAGRKVGVNWLVTPANIGMIDVMVHDCLQLGARDVMLLGYKGPDPSLVLDSAGMRALSAAVRRLAHLPLKLDVCWHPLLEDVPQLFARGDCGAGDEMLVITPDRAVQPCSFHHERVPFESFDDLRRIYRDMQQRKPEARTFGCRRTDFVPVTAVAAGTYIWQAHAGNNSGSFTIVGRFETVEQAQAAAASLRELAVAHERFMSEVDQEKWYWGMAAPPLLRFAEAHGFSWPEDRALWWEEQACTAPNMTVGIMGTAVILYHRYAMDLPKEPFREFFRSIGAVEYCHHAYIAPRLILTATGSNQAAVEALERYLLRLAEFRHPSNCPDDPPWGKLCKDPRVGDDTDQSAALGNVRYEFQVEGNQLRLALSFENPFAGPLALETYLRNAGFSSIEMRFEARWTPLPQTATPVPPKTGLFPEYRSLEDKVSEMTDEELGDFLLSSAASTAAGTKALQNVPLTKLLDAGLAAWRRREYRDANTIGRAAELIVAIGPAAAEWAREVWRAAGRDAGVLALRCIVHALPLAEVVQLIIEWFGPKKDRTLAEAVIRELQQYLEQRGLPGQGLPSQAAWAEFLAVLERNPRTDYIDGKLDQLRGYSDRMPN